MSTTRGETVVGVFEDRERAREAIEALKSAGFDADTISVLSPDRKATEEIAEDTGTHAASGAATGALAGGVLGGVGGWLVGIGALAIPGVGPFIAAGAFATALGGAAIGAGVGAIAGALVGMGIPEEHAKYYEDEARAGRTLVTVRAASRYDEAQEILRDHDAYDVESRGAAEQRGGRTETNTERVQLREEELVARTESREAGTVAVGKDIVSEQRTLEVPVRREQVTIDRTPVAGQPSDRPIEDGERTISVPVYEEHVEVEKRPVVYEEVSVGKREVRGTEQVSETVRREQARIEQSGDVAMSGGSRGSWDQVMPGYQQRWQERYGTSGDRWEDAEPGYRYGYEMRDRPEYRGRTWSDVEPDMRRDWSERNPGRPWDRASESVRETWENVTNR